MLKRISALLLALSMIVSAPQCFAQTAPSPVQSPQRAEIVTKLEQVTAQLEASTVAVKAMRLEVAALDRQVRGYKESNRLLDAAYIKAVEEAAELRATIAAKEREVTELKSQIEILKKERDALKRENGKLRKIVALFGGTTAALAYILLSQ